MSQRTRAALENAIQAKALPLKDLVGRDVLILDEDRADSLSQELRLSLLDVYTATLALGIYPRRYLRNRDGISLQDQLKLAESRVAVVGAGGLGGTVIQLLGRIGIGRLTVVDSDVFDETNLNRQVFCTRDWVGQPKAVAVQAQMKGVNPSVEVHAHVVRLEFANGPEILAGCRVIVDALDNVKDRLTLEALAKSLEDEGLKRVYGDGLSSTEGARRPEQVLGVPALTASFVANLEAMEVIKILLHRGKVFRNMIVFIDLEEGQLEHFVF
jgi:molybdopterin-synthase adenylyltransferase